MIKEFKEFIMRGNVVDLAVAVIIGAAFTAIVDSLVNDIIMPIIGVILGSVDFKMNRFNGMIVAISLGMGMIPLVAPDFSMWMPHSIEPLIDSGILLASISAVFLNLILNGAKNISEDDLRHAALQSDGGH